jgi:diguanylate cyclase (GGDEF)-like protein
LRGAGGKTIGVLALYDALTPAGGASEFTGSDLETVTGFAEQAAVAIENVRLHEEAERLSLTDALTGLWNRRYLFSALQREIERANRFGRPISVILLDLDRFKAINDTYGHKRGDDVLVEIAQRVQGVIREVDVFARYGGEEMCLLLPETDRAGAEAAAERVSEAVRCTPFGAAGEAPLRVTVSQGIAVYPGHGRAPGALLEAADDALYDAKHAGRDRWRVATGAKTGTISETRNPGARDVVPGAPAGSGSGPLRQLG